MIGTKKYEREFSTFAYALAALSAPALSVIIALIGALIASMIGSAGRGPDEFGSVFAIAPFLIVIFALWGFMPALVFGAVVIVPLERLRRRRNPPQWVYLVAGMGAAAIYVLVSIGTAKIIGAKVMPLAPWAVPLDDGAPIRGLGLLGGAIVLAGGLAGLIYERLSRVEYRPGQWRPSDGPR